MTNSFLPATALVLFASAALAETDPACSDRRFVVALPDTDPAELYAQVCAVGALADGRPVQILLHGGAYDHRYWDWPDARYSYVRAATARGYVTVNLDLLGYGASTRPDGRALTFELGAMAVAEVVKAVQAGELGFQPGPVILNGHSMGGIVAEHVAGRQDGIAALVISGLANTPEDAGGEDKDDGGGPPAGNGPPFVPASADPHFANEPWAEGYMVPAPGIRSVLFHGEGTIDPEIARQEDAFKETIALAELGSVMSGGSERPAFAGPSLYVLGRHDAIACQGQDCRDRFAGTDWHQIIDGAGHSLTLSLAAPEFFAATFDWLKAEGLEAEGLEAEGLAP